MDSDRVFEGEKKRPKGLFYVITFSILNNLNCQIKLNFSCNSEKHIWDLRVQVIPKSL